MPSVPYITFRLGKDTFALRVEHVREVLDLDEITALPLSPPYVRGVVNVRGAAVPVVDLRVKFGMPQAAQSPSSRIIVMEFSHENHINVVGGLADAVLEVVELDPSSVAPAPSVGKGWRSQLIESITQREGQFVMLLNVDSIFAAGELEALQAGPASIQDI